MPNMSLGFAHIFAGYCSSLGLQWLMQMWPHTIIPTLQPREQGAGETKGRAGRLAGSTAALLSYAQPQGWPGEVPIAHVWTSCH